jgi:hypothetical protein
MFNDVFGPMPQPPVPRESFTEGAEEPFEAMEIEEVNARASSSILATQLDAVDHTDGLWSFCPPGTLGHEKGQAEGATNRGAVHVDANSKIRA